VIPCTTFLFELISGIKKKHFISVFFIGRNSLIISVVTTFDFDVTQCDTVVSNHFHSVKILLFSSSRSRDFDGMLGTELPVSMYTTKTPIDMCRFNVRSSILKNLHIFCKRQISIKLFYLYQTLQCRDNYFFKIKFVFFLYLRPSASGHLLSAKRNRNEMKRNETKRNQRKRNETKRNQLKQNEID